MLVSNFNTLCIFKGSTKKKDSTKEQAKSQEVRMFVLRGKKSLSACSAVDITLVFVFVTTGGQNYDTLSPFTIFGSTNFLFFFPSGVHNLS